MGNGYRCELNRAIFFYRDEFVMLGSDPEVAVRTAFGNARRELSEL